MADIFDEVEEELRSDRAKIFWDKYGNFVIAAAVFIVLGTAGNTGWHYYSETLRLERADKYAIAMEAVSAGKIEDATKSFDALVADGGTGYGIIGRFQLAKIKADNADKAAAVTLYKAINDDTGVEDIYRDLALLFIVMNTMDSGDKATLESQISQLTGDDAPWKLLALEQSAALALRDGDKAKAIEIFQRLADDVESPSGLRARSSETLKALGQYPLGQSFDQKSDCV